jgi:hypothetical protein
MVLDSWMVWLEFGFAGQPKLPPLEVVVVLDELELLLELLLDELELDEELEELLEEEVEALDDELLELLEDVLLDELELLLEELELLELLPVPPLGIEHSFTPPATRVPAPKVASLQTKVPLRILKVN